MRALLDGLGVALAAAVGTWMLLAVPQRWLAVAVALVMYARAFRSLAFSEALSGFRDRLRLSWAVCHQLYCGLYAMAGGVACIGALVTLDRPLAFIAAFGAFSFAWAWGWILLQFLRSTDDRA